MVGTYVTLPVVAILVGVTITLIVMRCHSKSLPHTASKLQAQDRDGVGRRTILDLMQGLTRRLMRLGRAERLALGLALAFLFTFVATVIGHYISIATFVAHLTGFAGLCFLTAACATYLMFGSSGLKRMRTATWIASAGTLTFVFMLVLFWVPGFRLVVELLAELGILLWSFASCTFGMSTMIKGLLKFFTSRFAVSVFLVLVYAFLLACPSFLVFLTTNGNTAAFVLVGPPGSSQIVWLQLLEVVTVGLVPLVLLMPAEFAHKAMKWNSVPEPNRVTAMHSLAIFAALLTGLFVFMLHFDNGPLAQAHLGPLTVGILFAVALIVPFYQSVTNACCERGILGLIDFAGWRSRWQTVLERWRTVSAFLDTEPEVGTSGSAAGAPNEENPSGDDAARRLVEIADQPADRLRRQICADLATKGEFEVFVSACQRIVPAAKSWRGSLATRPPNLTPVINVTGVTASKGNLRDVVSKSVLAFLSDRFKVQQKELMVTSGIGYVLQRYPAARDAIVGALAGESVTHEARSQITFVCEARGSEDKLRVDLEGSVDGGVVISIEGKLNAPLQDGQPVDYAERLRDGGSLLFVCPSHRIVRLRPELLSRSAGAGQLAGSNGWQRDTSGIEWTWLTRDRRLGISSWDRLFAVIRYRASGVSPELASDLHQLEGLVAKYEHDLLSWTPEELRSGGMGLTFSKAVATTRVLCEIIAERFGKPIAPAWKATRATVRAVEEYWDWFGAKASISSVEFCISFEPTLWGEDDGSSPVRISLNPPEHIDAARRLYVVYLQMLALANDLLQDALDVGPATASAKDASWWMLPFPLRPGTTSEEAREDMANAVTMILAPLAALDSEAGRNTGE